MGRTFEALAPRETINYAAPASLRAEGLRGDGATARALPDSTDVPFFEVPDPDASEGLPAARSETDTARKALGMRSPWRRVTFQTNGLQSGDPRSEIADELVVWRQPDSPAAEQYRQVREMLLTESSVPQTKVILFVPVRGECDHSAAVANLALAMTEKNARSVLLIDADTKCGRVASLLGVSEAPGWSELLAGMPLSQLLQESGWPGLHVIARGNRLVGLAPGVERLASLLQPARQAYGHIFIKSPASQHSIASSILAEVCDGVCAVMTSEDMEHAAATECLNAYQGKAIRLLGSMVVSM